MDKQKITKRKNKMKKLAKFRIWIQTAFLTLWMAPIVALQSIPGCAFHCYACPLSSFGCPVGLAASASAVHIIPWLLIGIVFTVALFFGSLICGWACPFGLFQDLLAKIPTPKFRLPRFLGYGRYLVLIGLVIVGPWFSYKFAEPTPSPKTQSKTAAVTPQKAKSQNPKPDKKEGNHYGEPKNGGICKPKNQNPFAPNADFGAGNDVPDFGNPAPVGNENPVSVKANDNKIASDKSDSDEEADDEDPFGEGGSTENKSTEEDEDPFGDDSSAGENHEDEDPFGDDASPKNGQGEEDPFADPNNPNRPDPNVFPDQQNPNQNPNPGAPKKAENTIAPALKEKVEQFKKGKADFTTLAKTANSYDTNFAEPKVNNPAYICNNCPLGMLERRLPLSFISAMPDSLATLIVSKETLDSYRSQSSKKGYLNNRKLYILIAVVVLALFFKRFWCRVLCPLGGFLSLFNRFSIFHLRFDRKACIDCNLCRSKCDVGVKVEEKVNTLDCIRCLKCTDCGAICPTVGKADDEKLDQQDLDKIAKVKAAREKSRQKKQEQLTEKS